MKRMKLTLTAEFNLPPDTVLCDWGEFWAPGVYFAPLISGFWTEPELSFECRNFPPECDKIDFPNDGNSISKYLFENYCVKSKIEIVEH